MCLQHSRPALCDQGRAATAPVELSASTWPTSEPLTSALPQQSPGDLGSPVHWTHQCSNSRHPKQPACPSLHTCSPVHWAVSSMVTAKQPKAAQRRPTPTPAHLCSGYSSTVTANARSSAGSGRGSCAYCSAMPALTREARTQATLAAKKKLAALRLAAEPFLSMALTWQRRDKAEFRVLADGTGESKRQQVRAAQPTQPAHARQAKSFQDNLRGDTHGHMKLPPHWAKLHACGG